MDIRVEKTKNAISSVFLELRAKKTLEKITVKELCARAQINKSTFYSHYHDIYDLAEQLENEVIASVVDSVSAPEKIFEDPERFTKELMLGYISCGAMLHTLFSGTRTSELPRKMELYFKKKLYAMDPESLASPEKNIAVTYAIYGGYHAFMENRSFGDEQAAAIIGELAQESLKFL